jgi:hypothetical protein
MNDEGLTAMDEAVAILTMVGWDCSERQWEEGREIVVLRGDDDSECSVTVATSAGLRGEIFVVGWTPGDSAESIAIPRDELDRRLPTAVVECAETAQESWRNTEQSKRWVFTSAGQTYLDEAYRELTGMFNQIERLSDGFRVSNEVPAVHVELAAKDEWCAYTLSLRGDGSRDEHIGPVVGSDVVAVVTEANANFDSYW